MRDFVSKTARDLKPSGIRKFFDLCAGSPDIISLGVGEPDFVTPWQISSGGITAIKQGRTTYTGNAGLPELKKEIVEYLKRFNLDYKPEEVMAFGDAGNDLSMIKYAGLGICMGNGQDEVKKAADYITDDNDHDGIAKALSMFLDIELEG